MSTVSIKDLSKAAVLAALYNCARPQGMGFMHYDPEEMTTEQAQQILDEDGTRFDYLKGRVMKVDISKDELDPYLFDRDNGTGAAEAAINSLRNSGETNSPEIQTRHKLSKAAAAEEVKKELHTSSGFTADGGVATMTMGYDDVAEVLRPAIDKALEQ